LGTWVKKTGTGIRNRALESEQTGFERTSDCGKKEMERVWRLGKRARWARGRLEFVTEKIKREKGATCERREVIFS